MGGDFTDATLFEALTARQHFKTDFSRTPIEAGDENLASALTDSSGGSATTTIGAIPAVNGSGATTAQEASINNNFASVTAQINNLRLSLINRADMLPQLNLAGTDAANATIARYAKGGILATTHTTDNDQVILNPVTGRALAPGFGTGRRPYYAILIDTQASVASLRFKYGLALTNAVDLTTDDDQAGFWFDTDVDGILKVFTSVGGTDVLRTTGITLAVNTLYLLEMQVDRNRVPRFFVTIDGGVRQEVGRVANGDGLNAALTAATQLLPQQGHQTLATGSAAVAYLGMSCGNYAAV